MATVPWYDIERRGRRLEAMSKAMNTRFWNCLKDNNTSLAFAYLDRYVKIENVIQPYVEDITGVKKLIKKGLKLEADILA